MFRDEGFDEWTGMNDSLNEEEWMIHWMDRNEWFIEWREMNDLSNGLDMAHF